MEELTDGEPEAIGDESSILFEVEVLGPFFDDILRASIFLLLQLLKIACGEGCNNIGHDSIELHCGRKWGVFIIRQEL